MLERTGDDLAVARNEALRRGLRPLFGLAARRARRGLRRRIRRYRAEQEALRARYGVTPATPVRPWGPAVEEAVERYAAGRGDVRFAYTSGSTARPKKLAFPPQRLAMIKRCNLEAAAQAAEAHGIRRPTLFVFTALKEDDSLTALLLDEGGRPSLTDGLVMPSRWLWSPELAPLIEAHGATAARLWLLLLSDPGLLYSTNPSTLASFLAALEGQWDACAALVRAHHAGELAPEEAAGARRVLRRVAAPGWRARLARAAAAAAPPPPAELLPGLSAYACWDGGYVRPFLDRVQRALPPQRYTHVPMSSMSTETVETVVYYPDDRPRFLALAPDVLYELLPADAAQDPDPARLLPPWALEEDGVYALVVSDPYGLVRYHTGDLFRCAGRQGDVPDLRFLRRQGLAYSFTGEKLTGEQVSAACTALRAARPEVAELGLQLTLIPALPDPAAPPRYRLVLAHAADVRPEQVPRDVGPLFDELLGEQNRELSSKLKSGRLGATEVRVLAYDDLAAGLDGRADERARAWDTQFKLLPLYTRRWEECSFPHPSDQLRDPVSP